MNYGKSRSIKENAVLKKSFFLASLLAALSTTQFSSAFSTIGGTCTRRCQPSFLSSFSPLISELKEEDKKEEEKPVEPVLDSNGKEFIVGNVARVSRENLKAYQVPSTAKGSFDQYKQFTADETIPYLCLPVGLRGTITKIYNDPDLSANFPIQISFVPKEQTDEGYSAPTAFTMHFSPRELECVS